MRFSLLAIVVALTAPMFILASHKVIAAVSGSVILMGPRQHEWHVTTFCSWSTKFERREEATIAVCVTMKLNNITACTVINPKGYAWELKSSSLHRASAALGTRDGS
ncbi:hypothetical protein EV424DRAFT_1556719 [Suillus variegatus]|nr:hypothetical protein EV424DRAFT_1556719 [Suillus variegatus]